MPAFNWVCNNLSHVEKWHEIRNFLAIKFMLHSEYNDILQFLKSFIELLVYCWYKPTVAKASALPIWPWLFTGDTAPFLRQSKESGTSSEYSMFKFTGKVFKTKGFLYPPCFFQPKEKRGKNERWTIFIFPYIYLKYLKNVLIKKNWSRIL